ncbi:iron-hydroxamate ABC transporter substrate-binding protein [Cytobacillus horneckiae]|uniref:iron-hydroxamate ABC transporter substrate-binding protein n=1 Tax=Cytobacillus horneckiae TaxID=549687 RepID=UPI003D1DFD17
MKFKWIGFSAAAILSLGLAGCGGEETSGNTKQAEKSAQTETKTDEAKSENQTITYLNEQYEIPANPEKIVAASLEAMEDAAILGVKPIGAVTIGGELPSYLAEDLAGAESIGEKTQPNYETMLQMKPDVILGTSKYKPEVAEQLNKVATMVPVSHISTDWQDNLRLMAELTGKQDDAEDIISKYENDVTAAKEEIGDSLDDKKVVIIRVRAGNMYLYPSNVYLNPVLYEDLGIGVPAEVEAAQAQEALSLEQFAEMNPDYVFLQFEESENADKPKALDELQENAIFKSVNAVKNGHVFVNAVDPLAQGGTAWSKTKFLEAATESLAN